MPTYDPFDEIRSEAVDLIPPQVVAENAAKGLALREKHGRGGTEIGVARAQELVARGRNYTNEENPSAGRIAWLLWGGDEGRAWALEMKRKLGDAPKT